MKMVGSDVMGMATDIIRGIIGDIIRGKNEEGERNRGMRIGEDERRDGFRPVDRPPRGLGVII